jgi:hypothetical protein
MRFIGSLLLLAAGAVATLAACSSSSSSDNGCASNPFSCGAGTTCAPKDTSGAYACLPSGSGAKGSTCQNTPGSTTCGDGLTCLQQQASGGQCVAFCELGGSHGCDEGETCRAAGLVGTSTVFYICYGGTAPPPPADAGSDASGDAGSD